MNKVAIAFSVFVFCSFAIVLSMIALQQPVQAALQQPQATAETQQQCMQRVTQQYNNIADTSPNQHQDAYETALLLCKF